MVEKIFCDDCGKDMTNDLQFEAEIYCKDTEKNIIKSDLCKKCATKLKTYFK